MKEEFLHFLWQYKLFDVNNLRSELNETIQIVKAGIRNTNAGPDFLNAQLKINDQLWVGNIEIHINSSDWIKHKHQNDKAYDNVILHVVYNNDKSITDKDGNTIPTLELKDLINSGLIAKHKNLVCQPESEIACGKQIATIDTFTINTWLNRLAIERLERKSIDL